MPENFEKFTLIAPLSCFPSDNKLDAMPRRERIAVKEKLKNDALVLTYAWLQKRGISRSKLNRENPLFTKPVRLRLTVFVSKGARIFDIHNLSVKHFTDQVVRMGIISDDSIKYIPECVQSFGGYNPGGSYAEFSLEVINNGENHNA